MGFVRKLSRRFTFRRVQQQPPWSPLYFPFAKFLLLRMVPYASVADIHFHGFLVL